MSLNNEFAEPSSAVASSVSSHAEAQITPDTAVDNSELEVRKVSADRYFTEDLEGQQQWYDSRAQSYKIRSELLALGVITLGAGIPFIQVFGTAKWVAITSGAIGALIAILAGWQRIARYGETWVAYRAASEKMKHERRLYLHGAGHYKELSSTDAFNLFVEGLEKLIAEEQKLYWQYRENGSGAFTNESKH
jgi:Protein of unknown function (DUF4231)